MEIYNEKLRDLLDFEPTKLANNQTNFKSNSNLKIREHPNKGIYVQNLIQYGVTDLKDIMRSMSRGNQIR